jgi:hypothetical protein
MSMDLSDLKDFFAIIQACAGSVQACATVIAIIVGGVWSYMLFVQKRQRYPRANIEHRITHRSIPDNKLLLHVAVTVRNTGDVLLSLVSGQTRIQQILPLSLELLDPISKGRDPVKAGDREILWPLIKLRKQKWREQECEIEPGESDEFHYDFILDAEVQTIEVYSYFKNAKKPGREIGWGWTTIYDLGESDELGRGNEILAR